MFSIEPRPATEHGLNLTAGSALHRAITAFKVGKPVLIHDFDDREGEIDLIYPALAVKPRSIAQLRNDAGGLICLALSNEIAEMFDLPFLSDELTHPASGNHNLEYDARSSFSLSVNHRDTRTGITDIDRALTITKLGEAAANPTSTDFATEFRSPGHVHLLKAAPGLLSERKGHTELGIELAKKAGRTPAVVVCEMLDGETGRALSKADAMGYARRQNLPYLTGHDILKAADK